MFKNYISTFVALTLCVPCLCAGEVVIVTLDSVGRRIHAENPDIAAARLRIQEAFGRMHQSGRLSNPEISTAVERNTKENESKVELGLSQRFPLTQRLSLEKQVSRTELKAAEEEVGDVERIVAAEAKQLVVDVLAMRERRRLLEEQLEIMKSIVTYLSGLTAKGEGSTIDVGQARLESTSIRMQLHQTRAAELTMIGRLKPLLGMSAAQQLNVGGALPAAKMLKKPVDPAKRPDYQVAQLKAQAAKKAIELEKARRFDDVEVGLFGSMERSEDAPDGFDDESMLGVQFKIALPFWNRNKGAIQEAEAKSQRVSLEARQLKDVIGIEANTAFNQMGEWDQLIQEIDNDLLPLASEQVKLNDEAYENGQIDIQSVLRASAKRLEIKASRAEALAEFQRARIRYQAALGQQ